MEAVEKDTGSDDDDVDDTDDLETKNIHNVKIRTHIAIDVVNKDSVIALYSPPNPLKSFYLCKVIHFGFAQGQ